MYDHTRPGIVLDPRDLQNALRDELPPGTVNYNWTAVGKSVWARPKLRPDLLRRHLEATTLPSRRLPRVLPFLIGVAVGMALGALGLVVVAAGG